MKFRTEYTPHRADFTLTPDHPIVFAGSCFADNISARLREAFWDAPNPAGTLFNPASVARALQLLLLSDDPEREFLDSLRRDPAGRYHSMLFGTAFSALSEENALQHFRDTRGRTLKAFENARALCITFGTSRIYRMQSGEIAGNCHKFPAGDFRVERLSMEEILRLWLPLLSQLTECYPALHFIFTVSPVRHLKDGFTENSRSKATLLLAAEEICRASGRSTYFPAYEIMNDDLRDYRFYASDLAHPSEEAVDYIFDKFCTSFMDDSAIKAISEGKRIMQGLLHRPLLPRIEDEKRRYAELSQRHLKLRSAWNAILAIPDQLLQSF